MAQVKERAAILSVVVSGALAAAKLVAALLSGSLALMTDALHSLLDVGATLMTWFAVRLSEKPADEEHHYGHGKVESIAALVEVGVLMAVCLYVTVEAVGTLWAGAAEPPILTWPVVAVLVVAVVVDFFRARALTQVARDTQSQALASNALHFSADMWQSLVVLAGFAVVWAGYPQGDSVAALLVAAFIARAAVRLGREAIDTLMDAAPSGTAERIAAAAATVPGVIAVERVRVRQVGPRVFAEVPVAVRRALAPDRLVQLRARLDAAISAAVPGAEATITTLPRAQDDESVLERVLLIAASKRIPVHHVTVQQIEGRLAVALDVEVDGRMSLDAAHAIATRMEGAIREEFGPETEVETHIEPLEAKGLPGRDAPEPERAAIAATIHLIAAPHRALGDVHDVRVRDAEGGGRVVVLHAHMEGRVTVAAAHDAVDALEREIRLAYPEVARVVIHAEPRRPAPAA